LFAIGGKVMDGEWGLTQAHGETRSISVGYGSEMGYLLNRSHSSSCNIVWYSLDGS